MENCSVLREKLCDLCGKKNLQTSILQYGKMQRNNEVMRLRLGRVNSFATEVVLLLNEVKMRLAYLCLTILSAKKENPAADTAELEREVEALVYGLYGLNQEEINIIEK